MPRLSSVIIVSLAAGVIFWQLMLPPVVGLANNGDFGKILGNFGLGGPREHEHIFADTKYAFDSRYFYKSGYSSSELILVAPALALGAMFSRDGRLDLRYMGLIHSALFLAALVLFVPLLVDLAHWAQFAIGFAIVLLFCDVAYVSYLNSFYMDVAAYLFLLLATVFYLRGLRWQRRVDSILLVICCMLVVTSKPQHALLGFPIALLFLALKGGGRSKKATWAAIAAGLVAAAVLCLRYASPPGYQARGCFTVLFYRVLPNAKDAERTLADVGLDSSFIKYIGKHAYSDWILENPAFAATFSERVNYSRLGRFFLTHPRDAYVALHKSMSEAGRHRPVLGNFDSGSGMAPWTESRTFARWSRWKRNLFSGRGTRFLLCFGLLVLAVIGLLAVQRRDLDQGIVPGVVTLLAMAIVELLIASLGDAIDTPRHCLVFYELFDLILLTTLYLAIRAADRWSHRGYRFTPALRRT
ncbi:MAG TPA: hypothetical protein VMT32_05645 [Bryobacteraceae bacterium]|nr:hypothetical protein [Bryobacteraceae bacterium]